VEAADNVEFTLKNDSDRNDQQGGAARVGAKQDGVSQVGEA